MLCCVFLIIIVNSGHYDFVWDEENLRQALFSSYNAKIRPNATTHLSVSLLLGKLNKLDIESQAMSVNVLLSVEWYDHRLAWDEESYGNLTYLVTPFEDVWVPPLVVENAVEDIGALGGEERDRTPVRFNSQGFMSWTPPLTVTSSCQMNIARFPFDTQECYLAIIGWAYPVSEMAMTPGIVESSRLYTANGEFDLVNSRMGQDDIVAPNYDGTVQVYRQLRFYFTFRRRWPFYGQNLVLPMVLTSILMCAVFALPIESGEKMGFSLTVTVLLSYVVFMTWVTDNLPPVSEGISILQVYLEAVLCLGVLATLLTTWVLHLYHTPDTKPIPRLLRRFATTVLKPLHACTFRQRKSAELNNDVMATSNDVRIPKNQVAPQEKEITILPLSKTEYMYYDDKNERAEQYDYEGGERYGESAAARFAEGGGKYGGLGQYVGQYGYKGQYSTSYDQMHGITRGPAGHTSHQLGGDSEISELTWQGLAMLFDRFFLLLFTVVLAIVTGILILTLYMDY